jgi:uncharacterized membrane protein
MKQTPPTEPRARSSAIDALRGAAIVSMLAANLAGPCLVAPHPLWLRVYGSFAAPAFVLLAGMMTSSGQRPAPLGRLLRRALLLVTLAASIDVVCWGIEPFETFDVLYLLGLSLPLAGWCVRLALWQHALLSASVLLLAPLLRERLGYGPLLPEHLAYPWPSWRRALVDGWFPLFPWLGVALLGSLVGRARPFQHQTRWLAWAGGALSSAGLLAFWLRPPQLVTRKGYSELFYPPTLQYLAVAIGATLLALAWLRALERRFSLSWLATLGRSSLLLYVAHVALIALVLDDWFRDQTLPGYLLLYGSLTISMWMLAWAAERSPRWPQLRR